MIVAVLNITRPKNLLLAAPALLLGALLAVGTPAFSSSATYFALFAMLFSLAAGNIANDLADIEEDRINRPDRPLVRGDLSRPFAVGMALVLALLALVFALAIDFAAFTFVLSCQLSLLFYALQGKQFPLLANLLVSALIALSVLFGALVHASIFLALEAAMLAFIVNTLREIVKDIEDLEGDLQARRSTLAMRLSPRRMRALLVGIAFLFPLFLIALQFNPVFPIHLEPSFIALRWLLIILAAPFVAYILRMDLSSAMACGRSSATLKILLALGLGFYWIAFLLKGIT
jgi:geranylgeranylglycerol-phosphate geranylgeranyltransferase